MGNICCADSSSLQVADITPKKKAPRPISFISVDTDELFDSYEMKKKKLKILAKTNLEEISIGIIRHDFDCIVRANIIIGELIRDLCTIEIRRDQENRVQTLKQNQYGVYLDIVSDLTDKIAIVKYEVNTIVIDALDLACEQEIDSLLKPKLITDQHNLQKILTDNILIQRKQSQKSDIYDTFQKELCVTSDLQKGILASDSFYFQLLNFQ